MTEQYARIFQKRSPLIDEFINNFFSSIKDENDVALKTLFESMQYTIKSGGKRFRPVLALLTAEALKHDPSDVIAFASAIEFIHTYSLIHDDLPILDDDNKRRGQPSNHREFGEDVALLAGDALLTDAFFIIVCNYRENAQEMTRLLSQAAGSRGMVAGQMIDIKAQKQGIDDKRLYRLHRLKTGALIRVSVEGAAVICNAPANLREKLSGYGENLGLAFQVADDLLDFNEDKRELGSFPAVLGLQESKTVLAELTDACMDAIKDFGPEAQPLRDIALFNQNRLS